ncbi:MAG: SUMF1/EgtB/PvdO family nonheme iron enzyme [Luteolibacter sp.]
MQRSWLVGMPVWVAACLATANETKTVDLGGGVALEVVRVEAGTFTQGSPAAEEGRAQDESQRQVTISQPFWFGRSAVTVGQWKRFVAETGYQTEAETGNSGGFGWNGKELAQQKQFTWKSPGFAQSPDDPVCIITFPDATEFCKWLGKKTPLRITLPTEAQWEYACRAGSIAPWHDGSPTLSAAGVKTDLAWHKGNSNNSTHATASTASNLWGIRIGGNVSEWCLDWYAPYADGPVTDPLQTNQNLSDKPRRVLRGGSWIRDLKNTRSAARYRADPRSRNADIGFRVAAPYQLIAEAPTSVSPPPLKSTPSSAGIPDPDPAPGSTVPPRMTSSSFRISGLACLLIPLGAAAAIVVAIVKSAARRKSGSPPPFPSGNNNYLPRYSGGPASGADDGRRLLVANRCRRRHATGCDLSPRRWCRATQPPDLPAGTTGTLRLHRTTPSFGFGCALRGRGGRFRHGLPDVQPTTADAASHRDG